MKGLELQTAGATSAPKAFFIYSQNDSLGDPMRGGRKNRRTSSLLAQVSGIPPTMSSFPTSQHP